jgi:hypothetical protein
MDIFFIVVVEKEWLADQGPILNVRLCAGTERGDCVWAMSGNRPHARGFALCIRRRNSMFGFKHLPNNQFYAGKQGCSLVWQCVNTHQAQRLGRFDRDIRPEKWEVLKSVS